MNTLRTAYRNRAFKGEIRIMLRNGGGAFPLPNPAASYELRLKHHKGASPFAVATTTNGKLAIATAADATVLTYDFPQGDMLSPVGYGSLEFVSTAISAPPVFVGDMMIVAEGTPYFSSMGDKLVVYHEDVVVVVDIDSQQSGYFVARENHTGMQAISTVTGLQAALDSRIASSEKGAANGVTPLGADSKVPSAYLPSYVDDVEEYANLAGFPGTGSTGKIYTALDTGKIYRWSGSIYIEISASPGSTDVVPEGATNKYFTDARAQAALVTALAGKANTSHTHLLAAGATDVTITAVNLNALDDFADTTLHFHASDRARANHTGTQGIATVSGLQTALDAKLDDSQASAFGLSLLDDGDAATARATLGLGSAALQASGAFAAASHSHPQSDITNLVSDLAAKANLTGGNNFTGNQTFANNVNLEAFSSSITTAATAGVWNMGFETHMSSGSVVAGFGIRNTKWLENASGIGVFGAAIDYAWDDPTAGSEDSRVSFITQISGSAAYRFHVGNGVWLQGATGQDMGAGTFNATGYFLNGVDALASKANLASPALTGTPTAPTPALADDSTKIATTEYVTDKIAAATAGVSQVVGYSGNVTLANLVAGGVAPLASPSFTGSPKNVSDYADFRFGSGTNAWRIVKNSTDGTTGDLVLQHSTDGFAANFTNALSFTPDGKLRSFTLAAGGASEGGELVFEKPTSGTTLVGTVAVDIGGDYFRIFDYGYPNRGAKLHIPSLLSGVNSNLLVDDMMGRTFASLYGFSASASAATNTTALNAAIAAGIATGRNRITLPSGTFSINNLTTISNANDLIIEGSGGNDGGFNGGTTLAIQTATGAFLRMENCAHAGIKGCYIRHDVRRTAGYTIEFANSCFHPFADVRIDYAFNGIRVFGSSEADINATFRYFYGDVGVMFDGDATYQTYGANLKIEADNPYPISNNSTRRTYSNGLAVTAGEILWCPAGSRIYQVTGTGNLGATEPNTIGGTTGPDGFTTNISSGTATLKFVAYALKWVVNENYAYSIRIRKGSYVLNGFQGLTVLDTANSVGSRPKWVYFEGETDHTFSHGVYAEKGESLYLEGAWLGSSLAGCGLYVASTWATDVSIDPAVRIMGNWLQGAYFGATNNVRIASCTVEQNSQSGSAACDGVLFVGTTNFSCTGICSKGTLQRYGIGIDTGADYFVVKDNNLRSNVNAGVINVPGVLANRRIVADNVV